MEIRAARPADVDGCVAVLEALPGYFTPSTYDEVRRDLADHPSWVAVEEGEILGFVLAPRRFTAGAEITLAGVVPSHHGQGVGKALVYECLTTLAALGVTMVEVKTLDASAGYEPYVATRGFWEGRGFVQVDCIDPLRGWEPGNPAAIYVRSIA